MDRVLSRDIWVEGKRFTAGTKLEDVPSDHESLIWSGWTRFADPEPVAMFADPESDLQDDESKPTELASEDTKLEPAEPESKPEPVAEVDQDTRPINKIELDSGVVDLLNDAGIKTVQEAIDYRRKNNGFRTLKGVGKSTEQLIINALEAN